MWWRALAYKRTLCDSLYIQKRKSASSILAGADEAAEEPAPASAATTASEANSQGWTFSQQLGVLNQLDEKRKKSESRLKFQHAQVEMALAQLATVEGAREKGYESAMMTQIDKEHAIARDTLLSAQAKSYVELTAELERLQKIKKAEQEKQFQEESTKQKSDQIREKCEKKKKCREENQRVTKMTEVKKTALAECSRLKDEISAGAKDIKLQTEKLATLV